MSEKPLTSDELVACKCLDLTEAEWRARLARRKVALSRDATPRKMLPRGRHVLITASPKLEEP